MKKVTFFISIIFLSSCAKYNPTLPETQTPVAWKEQYSADKSVTIKNRFWELFEDSILNEIENRAIEANLDLQIAGWRINEARGLVSKERAKRLPQITLDAFVESDGVLINPRFFGSPNKIERTEQRQYNLLADFAYEVDFWGKFKAMEKSARYRQEATSWDYEFIYQTVVTDVAVLYFSLRILEEEISFLTEAIANHKDTVQLNGSRVDAGFDPEIDLSRAKLELSLSEVELEQSKRLYAIQQNALATLLGIPASSWSLPKGKSTFTVPALPEILPSEVLLRRADIQQHIALVAAGRSDVDVAIREFFPSFPLTAALGLSSPSLSDLFKWEARYWQYALRSLAPLFDGGARKGEVMRAKARFHVAFATYQKTVNQAFQDVEDALSTLHFTKLEYEAQLRAFEAAQDTSYLAKDRYDTGLISYLFVADSEKTSLEVARRSIFLRGEQVLAWIRVIRALGIQREETPLGN